MKKLLAIVFTLAAIFAFSAEIFACGPPQFSMREMISRSDIVAEADATRLLADMKKYKVDRSTLTSTQLQNKNYSIYLTQVFKGQESLRSVNVNNFYGIGLNIDISDERTNKDKLTNKDTDDKKNSQKIIVCLTYNEAEKNYSFVYVYSILNNFIAEKEFNELQKSITELIAIQSNNNKQTIYSETVNWLCNNLKSSSAKLKKDSWQDLVMLSYNTENENENFERSWHGHAYKPAKNLYFSFEKFTTQQQAQTIRDYFYSKTSINHSDINVLEKLKTPYLHSYLLDRLQTNLFTKKYVNWQDVRYENNAIEDYLKEKLTGQNREFLAQAMLFEINKVADIQRHEVKNRVEFIASVVGTEKLKELYEGLQKSGYLQFYGKKNSENGKAELKAFLEEAENHLHMCEAEKIANEYYADERWKCFENKALLNKENTGSNIYIEQVFPNPTTGNLTIYFELFEPGIVSINLISLTGKQLLNNLHQAHFETGKSTINLNIPQIANGLYFLQVNYGPNKKIEKIMVNR